MKNLIKQRNKSVKDYLLLFFVMTAFSSQIFATGGIAGVTVTYEPSSNGTGNNRIKVVIKRQAGTELCGDGNTTAYYPDIYADYNVQNGSGGSWNRFVWWYSTATTEANYAQSSNTFYLDHVVPGATYMIGIHGYTPYVYWCNGGLANGRAGWETWGGGNWSVSTGSIPAQWKHTNLQINTTSDGKVNLSWTKPVAESEMNNSLDDYGYTIHRRQRKWGESNWSGWSQLTTLGKSATSYQDGSANGCYEYEYSVPIKFIKNGYTWDYRENLVGQRTLGSFSVPTPQAFTITDEVSKQCEASITGRTLEWTVPISQISPCYEMWFEIKRQRVNANGTVITNSDSTIVGWVNGKTYGGSKFTANTNAVTMEGDNGGNRKFRFIDNLNLKVGQRYKYTLNAAAVIKVDGVNTITGQSGTTKLTATANIPGTITSGTSSINATIAGSTIQLGWADNIPNETKFYIYRTRGSVEEKIGEVNAGVTTFTDNDPKLCVPYTYTVKAYNDCHTGNPAPFQVGVTGSTYQVSGNIKDAYAANSLKGFKGYASEFVQLDWSVAKYASTISTQKLYRRTLGDSLAPTLLADLGSGTRQYKDQSADANTLYEYFIKATGECGVTPMVSDSVGDIGFRSPAGMVIGHIEYEGGISVQDCKVGAEKASGINNNKSLYFDGDKDFFALIDGDNSQASIDAIKTSVGFAHNVDLDFMHTASGRTIEFWFNATEFNGNQVYQVGIISPNNWCRLHTPTNGNTAWTFKIGTVDSINFNLAVQPNEWHHYAITEKADSTIAIYIDGSNLDADSNVMQWKTRGTIWAQDASSPHKHLLYVGANALAVANVIRTYKGYMDEFRIWGKVRTREEIRSTMNGYLQGNEDGLGIYYRMDEGAGRQLYDASYKSGVYNGNHAVFPYMQHSFNNLSFSTFVPPIDKLGSNAMTDANGNYIIPFVRYDNSGDLFKVTPYIANHQFQPSNRTLFIGNSTPVQNNVDFKDISSFPVTGTIYYGESETERYCPAVGVYLTVDGNIVMKDGAPAQTDANGEFSIRVPIGSHYVSALQSNHTFAVGRYPATGTHDFQQPVSGLIFVDNTKLHVIGKVAGGTEQEALPTGLGRGKNNIGQAKVVFQSTTLGGCYTDTAITDKHGEYAIDVYPLEYIVKGGASLTNPEIFIASNPIITFPVQNVNLTQIPFMQTIKDSVYDNNGEAIGVDSVQAHLVKNFIYRTGHSLFVLDTSGNPFNKGEKYIFIPTIGGQDTILTSQLSYPVFFKGGTYAARIKLTEIYQNKDSATIVYDTTSASDGTITVNNQLKGGDPETFETGDTVIYFLVNDPNITQNPNDPGKDFTKRFEVSSAIGQTQNTWNLDAYVLGSKADGTKFATQSPQIVDHILRDPPGSNSSAKILKNTELASSFNWSLVGKVGASGDYKIGADFTTFIGLGVSMEASAKAQATYKMGVGVDAGGGESYTETLTFSEDISTSSDPAFVGADADLFIGKSINMDFGLADNVTFMDTSLCGGNSPCKATDVVSATNGKRYSIGRRKGFQIDPKGYNTFFIYTQRHIKTQLIPDLKALRNNLLETSPNYIRVFTDKNDTKYGTNNDDPVWGTGVSSSTPLVREGRDSAGMSYVFKKVFAPNEPQEDSVRWYNQQIRLWEEALLLNEQSKLNAVTGQSLDSLHGLMTDTMKSRENVLWQQKVSPLQQNISFSAGQSYSRTIALSNTMESFFTWEVNASFEFGWLAEGKIGGIGSELSSSYAIGLTNSGQKTASQTTSTEYGFTLQDDDQYNFYSVDILDGGQNNGPIFKTRGAQTSCPYEPALLTEYYQKGTPIQPATVALEKPGVSIFPAKQVGVPSDQVAVFTLTLANENTENDMTYELSVDDATNANGAIIQIDGLSPNREFYCYAGQTMTKTLTVRKSPYATDFNDIVIYLTSKCDVPWAQLQVAQTMFSVSFVPTCSQVSLQSPTNQWTLNSAFNNKLPIIMKDYDLNFAGFEKAIFKYKPSASATWINAKEFYNLEEAGGDSAILSHDDIYTAFDWDVSNLPDGNYDIQIQTVCNGITRNSEIYSGKIDRLLPINFGQPAPLNGVLSASDELSIRFNETINQGLINKNLDIDVRAVLNATEIRHNTALQLNGANSKMTIPAMSLDNKSFTLELNAKKKAPAAEIIASQENLWRAGFDASNNFYFEIGSERVTTSIAADTNWHHYAITLDNNSHAVTLFVDGLSNTNKVFTSTIDEDAKDIVIGGGFNGAVHELRLWNDVRTNSEIQTNYVLTANANEANLFGYWPLDEGRGTIAADATGRRTADVPNSWWYANEARSADLNYASSFMEVDAAALTADEKTNFTLSFWFKPESNVFEIDSTTLFSNGNVDTGNVAYSPNAWRIFTSNNGKMYVKNNNYVLPVNNPAINNNEWYHFGLVVNRQGNTEVFINGEKTASTNSTKFKGFGGAKAFFGTYGRQVSSDPAFYHRRKFWGSFDEISFWNSAREQKQIARDAHYRLKGDEPGLLMYYPFEKYDNIGFGLLGLTETIEDLADKTVSGLPAFTLTFKRENQTNTYTPTFGIQTAPVKIERPVEAVTFNYVVNNDQVIITPTTPQERIEKTILDITVRNIQDMNGNRMSSAVTWTAFVNKNQVLWTDDAHEATIAKGQEYSFTATIENKGGKQENYSITNLPLWLSASKNSGTINPLSTQQITFTVKEGLNIGTYEHNIALTNQFGSGEILALTLNVTGAAPTWSVNPLGFENSMGFVGQLRINGVLSTDENDMIAAFVGDEVRGVAKVNRNNHYVYLNVYSNTENEALKFRIYDASTGLILDDVNPTNKVFSTNTLDGTQANPVIFEAGATQLTSIELKQGWNWISVNVNPAHAKVNSVLANMNASNGDLFKTQTKHYEFNGTWIGDTASNLDFRQSYRIKVANAATLQVKGATVNLKNTPINIVAGWNWVSYLGANLLQVNEAMASFNASTGDVLKGQKSFAVYDANSGWSGSLTTLEPNKGYMLSAANAGTIIYPKNPSFGKNAAKVTTLETSRTYENNMNVIAELVTDNYSIVHNYLLIAKDAKGNLLGGVSNSSQLYYLTVEGNTSVGEVKFFLQHKTTAEEIALKETLKFVANELAGYPQTFKLHLDEQAVTNNAIHSSHMIVYPNPVSGESKLQVVYTSSEMIHATVEVYSILGVKVGEIFAGELAKGENKFTFNADKLARGVYMIVVNKNGVNETVKFSK